MLLSELQYDLPLELIAQQPAEPRDSSRLLVVDRATGHVQHGIARDIVDYLDPGDCLVLNDTQVIPARFFCRRPTGGKSEGLFLHTVEGGAWQVMLKPSARMKVGRRLTCVGSPTTLLILERCDRGEWIVRPEPAIAPLDLLEKIGRTPLPPYIRHGRSRHGDRQRYQTVYAERPGAVAAPTAGLHFTPDLLERLNRHGVGRADVTLHVGAGTFVPVQTDDLAAHVMHSEWFEAPQAALTTLRATRAAGGKVAAVGTTAVRVLESLPAGALDASEAEPAECVSNWTDIFIYPPYTFRHVNCMLTNFHLPGSTLLALVMAWASPELIRDVYQQAIEQRYRFYSYGDAMLIL